MADVSEVGAQDIPGAARLDGEESGQDLRDRRQQPQQERDHRAQCERQLSIAPAIVAFTIKTVYGYNY